MKKIFKVLNFLCLYILLVTLFSCNVNKKSTSETTINMTSNEEVKSGSSFGDNVSDENETAIREIHTVSSGMDVVDIAGYRDTDKSTYIEIEFSKEIADKFDATSYVKVSPDISFNVSKFDKKLILKGEFDPSNSYKITALSGIKAVDGTVTNNSFDKTIAFTQKKPKIVFTNEGIILPSVNEKKVYIRTLNVTKVNIIVRKVFVNNTTQFLQRFDFTGNGTYKGSFKKVDENGNSENEDYNYFEDYDYYSYDQSNNFDNVGDEIYNVYFDIENEVDTWVQTAIDLTGIIDSNGFYIVEAKFDKDGVRHRNGKQNNINI